ncbi:hypothetical protein, partial [Sharpea azabuensis]
MFKAFLGTGSLKFVLHGCRVPCNFLIAVGFLGRAMIFYNRFFDFDSYFSWRLPKKVSILHARV